MDLSVRTSLIGSPMCLARSLAGNPDSLQAVVFLTSIIDEIMGVATYYVHYHAISDLNKTALRSAKPSQWLSGQTSSITTTVHGGMFRDARRAARRLA